MMGKAGHVVGTIALVGLLTGLGGCDWWPPALQERIGQQEAELKAFQADKVRTQTKVTELTRTVEEMTAQMQQMQQTNSELKMQVDQLRAALAEADARAKAKPAPKTSSPMKRKR
jgi:peptidoglycan hydrolase CwlO-like protein